jgi:hypothetical protein
MLKIVLELLKTTESNSDLVKIAKGKNLFPSNWRELKNYIKLNTNG